MSVERRAALRAAVAPYEGGNTARAIFQLATSFGLYVATVGAMYWAFSVAWWLPLVLAPLAGGFLIRTFIVQHDCGHGSFFASRRANDITGTILGWFTLAPYQNWRRQHAQHHANWNNLDRRESGSDIYSVCLTVEEYRALSVGKRIVYRLVRHPLVAHVAIPPVLFLLFYRVPFDTPKDWRVERWSVTLTNLAFAGTTLALGLTLGFGAVAMVQLPIIAVTTITGVWLFSVQHRFETARWLRQGDWTFQAAALEGTSYLKLPRALQWFTGNIGFHHIHHLSPRVPNYRLEECHRASAILRIQEPLTLTRALGAGNLTLWDEDAQKLVRFRDARN